MVKRYISLIVLLIIVVVFYSPFFINKKLPIPADTIVSLYSPYRDFYRLEFPNGMPFKNFLITDPVRQTYIWKELIIDIFEKGQIPSWNPYEMAGKPLVSNFQSSAFYPLNLILFFKPFYLSWSIFIILQSVLFSLFTFLYLKKLKLHEGACLLGSVSVAFSGFSVSWLTWGTIIHTVLWLPLLLLIIENIFSSTKRKKTLFASLSLVLICSFLAGHLQSFFYVYLLTASYFLLRFIEHERKRGILLYFIIANITFGLITIVQWLPTFQFLNESARSIDQKFQNVEGWFIPWRNLVQFVSPDFYGNPSTLNYFGKWNYAEFIGYTGLLTFVCSFYAFFKKNSTVIFYALVIVIGLIFSLPTGISSIPYLLEIPFVSTTQPTRLIFIVSFAISILGSIGLNYLIQDKRRLANHLIPIGIMSVIFIFLIISVIYPNKIFFDVAGQSIVSSRNLIFPIILFVIFTIGIIVILYTKNRSIRNVVIILILLFSFFDLIRFSSKFTPFTSHEHLYPVTKAINFLLSQEGTFRIASLDRRILAPNFMTHYKLQTIEGYDPLYLKSYGEFITAMERNSPDIRPPYGFNRIITPHNYESQLFDFLNTKFVLTLDEMNSPKMVKVYEEGETKIYYNNKFFERVYFVSKIVKTNNAMKAIYENDLKTTAIVGMENIDFEKLSVGEAKIVSYKENQVIINTTNSGNGFLVISDTFYPTWNVYIDGIKSKIIKTNHAFRGVFVPTGNHTIIMKDSLF